MELTGKKALVTGGSGDLGGAIARELARNGVDVAITYVGNKEGADDLLKSVGQYKIDAFAVQLDQRDPASIKLVVDKVIERFGGLDILINNAAWNIGIPFKNLDDLNEDIWDKILEINLRGPFLLSRACTEYLKANGSGRIVNIASIGGIAPEGSSIAYSSSKAGLIHLTRCLAVAMAPDVAVNCIAPGLIENSRMAKNLPQEIAKASRDRALLGKVGSPEDISRQVVTFCKTDTVTGQIMVIDGGAPVTMR